MTRIGEHFLEDATRQYRKCKALGDGALAQVANRDLFRTPGADSNSIAILIKHISGNMRSRWTDFPASDGEKRDRNRDSEFEVEPGDTKELLLEHWETGWRLLFAALEALGEEDLLGEVRIRGEAHTAMQAVNRQLTHYAYHVGQIVFLARHFAGGRWKSLSIPRGKSKESDVSKDGKPYQVP